VRLVPNLHSRRFVHALLDICGAERIDFVFPLIDPDIPVLAANRAAIETMGAHPVVVSSRAVDIAADKVLTSQFFAV